MTMKVMMMIKTELGVGSYRPSFLHHQQEEFRLARSMNELREEVDI